MSSEEAYRAATERAEARRAALLDSIAAATARVTPARLRADAKDKVTQGMMALGTKTGDMVRDRPVMVAATASALVAYLARRPIAALFKRLYVRVRDRNSENDNG
ncbi:hypothetical protein WG908_12975 [Sphingobium sp. AN641]|uniref:hypothetical protein n=1 Tax=Sphingobium sp. AN641 TaxID=3133443 RepID=UPI0030BB87A0